MSLIKEIKQILTSLFLFVIAAVGVISFLPVDTLAQIEVPEINDICRGSSCPGGIDDSTVQVDDANDIVRIIINIANFLTLIGVAFCVIFLIVAGYFYMTANGDTSKVETAQNMAKNCFYALVIIIMAYTAVFVVTQILTGDFLGGILGSQGGGGS